MRFADPVPADEEAEFKRKEAGLKNGYYTFNEVREEEGKDPQPDGDTVLVPSTMKPLALILNPPVLPALPNPGNAPVPEDEPEARSAKSHVTEDPADRFVAERVRWVTGKIKTTRPLYEAIYADMKRSLLSRFTARKTLPRAKKEFEETARVNELVRFLVADWEDWIGILLNPTEDALKDSLAYAGKRALTQLDLEQPFDLLNPNVLDWLNSNALIHARSISDTVKDEVTVRIMEGVERGLGAEEIASLIEEFFDGQAKTRALRITRSEVISGYAEGSLAGYRQSSVVKQK